jgi:DNA-binding Xre family transcriptional regulator
MKYYRLYNDIIEFERDIINDILPFKYLDKICRELNITCEVAFVDDT